MLGVHLLKRIEKLRDLVFAENAEAALILKPANIKYFTGSEAAALIALREGGTVVLVPPLLYQQTCSVLEEQGIRSALEVVVYTPKPEELPFEAKALEARGLKDALKRLLPEEGLLLHDGVDLDLAEALGGPVRFRRINVEKWRAVKEWWEIEFIRRAVAAAEAGFRLVANELGEEKLVSETEVAGLLEYGMRVAGAEDHAFPTIVAFGDNTIYPHAAPSPTRYLRPGTPVVMDAGARVGGYCSDMTRSFMYGFQSPDYRAVIEALVDAINSALEKAVPGVRASEVDAAARRELEKHGLAKYFIHSLGHGVGLEVHEPPRLSPLSSDVLEEGMVVTIEPGVYIESSGVGARLEEMVLITSRGPKVLTRLPLDLFS